MGRTSPLERIAGARPIRAAVNAGFAASSRRRMDQVARLDPVRVQERTLLSLVRKASATRFGRDHHFDEVRSVADFQARVRLRTYEDLWTDYLKDYYPVFDDLTWPGR